MSRSARSTVLAVAIFAGCGLAAGRDYSPALFTLAGTITSSDVPTPATVRVAVVWKHRDPQGNELSAVQELSVRAEFPVGFHADLPGPPPEEAMNAGKLADGGPAALRFSTGTLLVYDDRDGDQKLDLSPLDDLPTADVILGAPDRLSIYYLEGAPSPDLPEGVQPGFNLWLEPLLVEPAPGAAACEPTPAGPVQILPPGTDIQIALTATPGLTRLICDDKPATAPDAGPLGQPTTVETRCSADNTAFVTKRCTSSEGLCSQAWCYYDCGALAPGSEPPAGWPCP
jgi:hypothetical protein